jgi:hypothetical protein
MKPLTRLAALAMAAAASTAAAAAEDPCSTFLMDVNSEVDLFQGAPAPVESGREAATAPEIEPGKLYVVSLHGQQQIRFAAPRESKAPDPTKTGGMLRFTVAEPGSYRVSVDANFWVDVALDGKALSTLDFRSVRECPGPRKIVTYNLPVGAELLVQLIDASQTSVRLTVTPVPPKIW